MGISSSNTSKKVSETKPIIKEGQIKHHPIALTKYQTKIIMEQMDNSICKIVKGELIGTGFLCLLPNPDLFQLQPALITCFHILGKQELKDGNEIELFFGNKTVAITIDKSRYIYTNESYDITIIELEKDEFPFNSFLKIDDAIFNVENEENLNNLLINQTIYVIHYPKGKEVKYSIDTIDSIDDGIINHFCTTDYGSSGSPILNLQTFGIIGIHKGKTSDGNFNLGQIIKFPITEFNKLKSNIKKVKTLSLKNDNKPLISKYENIKNKTKKLGVENQEISNTIKANESESILDIISKLFLKNRHKFLIELSEYLKKSQITDIKRKEIIKQFNSRVRIVFDSKRDKNTLNNLLGKISGLSNLAIVLRIGTDFEEKKTEYVTQLTYLKGKIEYHNNIFSFKNVESFGYRNWSDKTGDEYEFTSFMPQNSYIYVKNKNDNYYIMVYTDEYEVEFIIKAKQNFMDHPIIGTNYANDGKIVIKNKKIIDEFFDYLEGLIVLYVEELLIYIIEN